MHVALVIRTLMLIIFIFHLVSQYPDVVSKIANSFAETIIIQKFGFKRDAKKINSSIE
jgi:hypothetical protein